MVAFKSTFRVEFYLAGIILFSYPNGCRLNEGEIRNITDQNWLVIRNDCLYS